MDKFLKELLDELGDLKIKKLMNEVDLHDLEKILAEIAKMSAGKSLILKDKVLNLIELRDTLSTKIKTLESRIQKVELEIKNIKNEDKD